MLLRFDSNFADLVLFMLFKNSNAFGLQNKCAQNRFPISDALEE